MLSERNKAKHEINMLRKANADLRGENELNMRAKTGQEQLFAKKI